MRIIIAGVGTMGEQLLEDLTRVREHEVVAIDTDPDRCELLADTYDALVINGDAANPDVLEQAQIDLADGIVAASGSDAINTIVAMLAHRQQVPRIVVKIETNALRGALEEIGVTDIITPALAAAARAQAALHGSDRADLTDLMQGGLRLGEITVGDGADGIEVAAIDLPDGALAVAVLHGHDMTVANDDVQLHADDVVHVLASDEDTLDRARRALG